MGLESTGVTPRALNTGSAIVSHPSVRGRQPALATLRQFEVWHPGSRKFLAAALARFDNLRISWVQLVLIPVNDPDFKETVCPGSLLPETRDTESCVDW
jgi:hypothetical protein